ncbi:MAG: tRNA 2-selenouridine(34) synthase MnmH [Saprospiraceae bacterium]|nr:tRNA 2-selenouridine(34) synthase MnmH [Saprospiraceae bacterium]
MQNDGNRGVPEIGNGFSDPDVRSPGEFNHAHIPGALSFPLFTDEERAVVGTLYKQESREVAIKKGLDYFGPRMRKMVEDAEMITQSGTDPSQKTILIHCWRGGMRSGAVAWLLSLYGFDVYLLQGGYKAYRQWVHEQFTKEYPFIVIGGYTGSGKTHLLDELKERGETIIDLEGLASHKGSAFGNIGMPDQPSQEMFENLMALEIFKKSKNAKALWVEDESQRIGAVNIPGDLFRKMSESPVFFLDIPFSERLDFIIQEYGSLSQEKLVNAIIRIKKRLGGLETRNAVNHLIDGEIKESFSILLKYYDKFYLKSLDKKNVLENKVVKIQLAGIHAKENADRLLAHVRHGANV